MVGKAIMSIKRSGLFPTALLEWNGFNPQNKTWEELKMHFSEVYQLLITSGAGGLNMIDASAAHMVDIPTLLQGQEAEDDDNTVTTLTNALGSMAITNNANT